MAQAKKSTAKKSETTSKAKGGTEKDAGGKPRGGLAQPVQPDDQLAELVGKEPLTRAEMTKRIWDHIKKNDLQDPQNRRMINADDKLRPIFGKDQVSMFEMTKLVNQHVK